MTAWSLRKWYFDCVAEDGTVWIGYAGWVRWSAFQISFASSLSLATKTSLRGWEEPRIANGRLDWSCEAIEVRQLAAAQAGGSMLPPRELYPGVTWQCVAPAADVTVTLPDREIKGRGYAEVLTISVPPWTLPIRQLRWGRLAGETTSLAWIQWIGDHPVNLVLRDGAFETATSINEEGVLLADGTRLALREPSLIRSDRLAKTLRPLKPIVSRLPKSFTGTMEQKWRSRGTVAAPGRPSEEGWVIHELITFPAG
jgi:hypothetical protein